MTRTISQLAREALAVQDACNLSGVAQSFARAMHDLRRLPEGDGTDACNNHPITRLWIDKLCSLSGLEIANPLSRDYTAVTDLAERDG